MFTYLKNANLSRGVPIDRCLRICLTSAMLAQMRPFKKIIDKEIRIYPIFKMKTTC